MKWICSRLIFLVFALSLAITGALWIGHAGSNGDATAFLKFDQCELPCWIGIIPGKTKWSDTRRYIEAAYSSDKYLIQFIDDSHITVSLTGTPNILEVDVIPDSYSDENSLVYGIMLIPYSEFPENKLFTVGDVLGLIRTPNDLILSIDGSSYAPIIRFEEGRVHLKTLKTQCTRVLITQKLDFISFYSDAPEQVWLSQPSTWRGFDRCYSFQEQSEIQP